MNNVARRRWLVIAIAFVASACVTTSVTRVGQSLTRPVVTLDQVVIYRTADKVPGKYEEVALLNSSGATGWTDEEKMYKNMRYEAGRAGANAIILDAISEPGAGAKVAAAFLGVAAERKGKAIAIYVFPDTTKKR